MTIKTFDYTVKDVLHVDDIKQLQPFTQEQRSAMQPGGMTALHDAIHDVGQHLLDTVQSGETALFCILQMAKIHALKSVRRFAQHARTTQTTGHPMHFSSC